MNLDLPPLSPVDIAALVALLAGVIQGYRRRLSGELARMFSLLTAFVLGLYACRPCGQWLVEHTRLDESTARGAAFVGTLIASVGAMFLIRFVLGKIMRVIFEPTVDLLGGCIAGFLRMLVLTIVVFISMNMWEHDYLNRKFGEESAFGTLVIRWTPFVEDILARLSGNNADSPRLNAPLLNTERPAARDNTEPATGPEQEPPGEPEKKANTDKPENPTPPAKPESKKKPVRPARKGK